jgi:hypothetical protein
MKLIHVRSLSTGQKWYDRYVFLASVSLHLFNCTLGYTRSLASGAHLGRKLLRDCLMEIHKDIITCWNFKGQVLNCRRFWLFLLYLRPRR